MNHAISLKKKKKKKKKGLLGWSAKPHGMAYVNY